MSAHFHPCFDEIQKAPDAVEKTGAPDTAGLLSMEPADAAAVVEGCGEGCWKGLDVTLKTQTRRNLQNARKFIKRTEICSNVPQIPRTPNLCHK